MKIAIYNMHFAVMGGGERRSALLASHLSRNHDVTLFVLSPLAPELVKETFGIDLANATIVSLENKDHLTEIATVSPDVFINNSHGSLLPNIAPLGIYMCMFPDGEKPDLSSYAVITANSLYTAKWILRRWGYESRIVYSACEFMGPRLPKQKIILNVSRFTDDGAKRQDKLVEAFRRFVDGHASDWQLHLMGNVGASFAAQRYLDYVRLLSEQYPIQVFPNVGFDRLRSAYGTASIYWHAMGYGFEEECNPVKQEHFGMSIVEAMSAGAVPLAFDGGGPRETIRPYVSGFLWKSIDELIYRTQLLTECAVRRRIMSALAVAKSRQFGAAEFLARMDAIIESELGERLSRRKAIR